MRRGVSIILDFERKSKEIEEGGFFSRAISIRRVVVPSPKIVINLPGKYEKLPC